MIYFVLFLNKDKMRLLTKAQAQQRWKEFSFFSPLFKASSAQKEDRKAVFYIVAPEGIT